MSEELRYFSTIQQNLQRNRTGWSGDINEKHFIKEAKDTNLEQIPSDESSASGYQVIIQTVEEDEENILTKEGLLRHVQLMEEIMQLKVDRFGR